LNKKGEQKCSPSKGLLCFGCGSVVRRHRSRIRSGCGCGFAAGFCP